MKYLKTIFVTCLLTSGLLLSGIASASNKFYINVCVENGITSTSGTIDAVVTVKGTSFSGDFQTNNVCTNEGTYVTGNSTTLSPPVSATVALKAASIKLNYSWNGTSSQSGKCQLPAMTQTLTFTPMGVFSTNYKANKKLYITPNFNGSSITSCSVVFQ